MSARGGRGAANGVNCVCEGEAGCPAIGGGCCEVGGETACSGGGCCCGPDCGGGEVVCEGGGLPPEGGGRPPTLAGGVSTPGALGTLTTSPQVTFSVVSHQPEELKAVPWGHAKHLRPTHGFSDRDLPDGATPRAGTHTE